MFKRLFFNKGRSIVAIATIATLLLTGSLPARAIIENNVASMSSTQEKPKYRNVMYYGDWSIWEGQKMFFPQYMPADKYTHLNFAFLDFDANGNLVFTDDDADTGHPLGQNWITYNDINGGILNAFQEIKRKNPNLKIGVSLGGWSKSGDFTAVSKNALTRAKFVSNVLKFIEYCDMDFVDIDWEYPTAKRDPDLCDNRRDEGTKDGCPEDKQYFVSLLQEFRTALDKRGKDLGKTYELTAALPAPIAKVESGIDVPNVFKLLDFANIMTYDMRGAWDQISGHQAGLYTNPNDPMKGNGLSVDESVKYYLSKGAPSDKIVIGAAFYTRGWEKVSNDKIDSNNPGLFGKAEVCAKDADFTPTPGALPEAPLKDGEGGRRTGTWSYNALDKLKQTYTGMKEYWDDSAKAPYLYNESTGAFFTYDNIRSVEEKCNYVKKYNLGGMISWMSSQDKATNPSSPVRDELTNAIYKGLYGTEKLPQYYLKQSKLNITVNVTIGKAQWGNEGVIKIDVKNNETLKESDKVLKAVETAAKSIKNAKIYIETDAFKITGSEYPTPVVKEENGYYILDFGGLFDGKIWSPGQSKTFTLKTDRVLDNLDGLVGVTMVQRLFEGGTEFGRQTIYGNSYDSEIVNPDGNFVPTLSGVKNRRITVGDSFNPLEGVTAYDVEDGDLTSKIQVSGYVNTRKSGKYELTYSVKDSKGAERKGTITVEVIKRFYIEKDNYSPTASYKQNDIVVYNGHYYQLIYYTTAGIKPGDNPAIWKDLGEAKVYLPDPDDSVVDLATVAENYNRQKGESNFNSNCDRNNDGIVDIYDLVLTAKDIK